MAIARNRNTTQAPNLVAGRTGTQSLKFIPAPRIYVKTPDSTTAAPLQTYFTKSNGVTPTGWTDLGIVDGNAAINYVKKTTQIKTGMDNYLRDEYTSEKSGTATFSLAQFDDIVLEQISGLTASVITAGSIISYQVGQDELTNMALLMVVQNKLDSKEWQFYNPNAIFNFAFDQAKDGLLLKCTVTLPFFTVNGNTDGEVVLSATEFV